MVPAIYYCINWQVSPPNRKRGWLMAVRESDQLIVL